MVKYVTSIKYPVERTRESDAWASAEGVTLSGVRKDKTECQGNSGEARKGAEGARRKPNLSGKRIEAITIKVMDIFCSSRVAVFRQLFLF